MLHSFKVFLSLSIALAVAVSAEDPVPASLPPCALQCTVKIAPNTKCTNIADFSCSCVDQDFKDQTWGCYKTSCDTQSIAATSAFGQTTCAAAGFPLTPKDIQDVKDFLAAQGSGGKPASGTNSSSTTTPSTKSNAPNATIATTSSATTTNPSKPATNTSTTSTKSAQGNAASSATSVQFQLIGAPLLAAAVWVSFTNMY